MTTTYTTYDFTTFSTFTFQRFNDVYFALEASARRYVVYVKDVSTLRETASRLVLCHQVEISTRTTVSQAHSYQWLGSFGNRGNGLYRTELRQSLAAIRRYLTGHQLPPAHTRLAPRRPIWERGCTLRSGWVRLCDPWQRLQPARSSERCGVSAPAT